MAASQRGPAHHSLSERLVRCQPQTEFPGSMAYSTRCGVLLVNLVCPCGGRRECTRKARPRIAAPRQVCGEREVTALASSRHRMHSPDHLGQQEKVTLRCGGAVPALMPDGGTANQAVSPDGIWRSRLKQTRGCFSLIFPGCMHAGQRNDVPRQLFDVGTLLPASLSSNATELLSLFLRPRQGITPSSRRLLVRLGEICRWTDSRNNCP
jgi:hypothetical protein